MKVAIFGAGTMGRGIAQVFAANGHTALMYASSIASAQRHKEQLDACLLYTSTALIEYHRSLHFSTGFLIFFQLFLLFPK